MLYDISIPIRPDLAVWPGDEPYRFHLGWEMAEGATVNVGQAALSVHTGTHIDAPFHFDAQGEGAGELDLNPYLGPAFVVDVSGREIIGWDLLEHLDLYNVPRLLLKTLAWTDHTQFPTQVPTLAPDVPEYLAERGVLLVGVDVPSMDTIKSVTLPIHHALNDAGIRILESLDLRAVPPGLYHLSALPLRLMGADGAPVRAVLWEPW